MAKIYIVVDETGAHEEEKICYSREEAVRTMAEWYMEWDEFLSDYEYLVEEDDNLTHEQFAYIMAKDDRIADMTIICKNINEKKLERN